MQFFAKGGNVYDADGPIRNESRGGSCVRTETTARVPHLRLMVLA